MFRIGTKKIDKELNVIKIVHNLNFIKTFMKNSFLVNEVRHMVAHSRNNTIDLDNSSSASQNSSDSTGDENCTAMLSKETEMTNLDKVKYTLKKKVR